MRTLEEAQEEVQEILASEKLGICPCCAQNVWKYRSRIYAPMAVALCDLVRIFKSTNYWVHVKELRGYNGGGDFAKLVRWGLIFQKANEDSGKRSSGCWMPTQKGIDFVERKITVVKYLLCFNNTVLGEAGKQVSIIDALGRKFNYSELFESND